MLNNKNNDNFKWKMLYFIPYWIVFQKNISIFIQKTRQISFT